MRTAIIVLVLCGCGGNWSNRDLEFLSALPQKADLQSKLPGVASTSQGLSQRKDGLNVGEPSKAYADAKRASEQFNSALDNMLNAVETLRAYPPTKRTTDARVWGPFPDSKNPGVDFQLTIRQSDERTFMYALQARKNQGAFFDVMTGGYVASETLKKGQGQLLLHIKEAREQFTVDGNLAQFDQIEVGYFTSMFPKRVDMIFTAKPGATGFNTLQYVYREQEDKSGAIGFQYKTNDPNTTVVDLVSFWNADGAGRAQGKVIEGNYKDATTAECWDSSQKVTFFAQSWAPTMTSGMPSNCVTVAGF